MSTPLFTQFDWQTIWPDGLNNKHVLDLACGSGRNGLWFASQGATVDFIDKDLSRLPAHVVTAAKQYNLEDGSAPHLETNRYDIIVVVNYLHRPLTRQIKQAIKPGGIIIYETFTTEQATIGRPKNPDFLLKPQELKQMFANWHTLIYFEGAVVAHAEQSHCFKAQLIAQKPLSSEQI